MPIKTVPSKSGKPFTRTRVIATRNAAARKLLKNRIAELFPYVLELNETSRVENRHILITRLRQYRLKGPHYGYDVADYWIDKRWTKIRFKQQSNALMFKLRFDDL